MLNVQAAANGLLHRNVHIGRPEKLNISVSDHLLDSPAFRPLRW
jgi:hypothetical protein